MTLLRHVADLAAAIDPAAREGDGNAIPVVVPGLEKKPQAMPMTWVGQRNEGRDGREAASAEIPPRPDYGAKDVTPEEIAEIRESAMTGKDWKGEARGAATAKILPEGRLAVEVNAITPREGSVLPPGSVRVSGEDMAPGEMLATLHTIAPHIGKYTDQERKAATAMAYRLERLKERDPKGFAKLPGELQNFLVFFKERMDDERAAIVPKSPKDKTVELETEDWEGMTDRSAEHALKRAVRSFGTRMAIRGVANLPAGAADFAYLFSAHDKVKEFAKDWRNSTRRKIPVPPEYEEDRGLQAAESVGGSAGRSAGVKLVLGGARRLRSLLNIFK